MATEWDAPAWLTTSFNARQWSGVAVFDRGAADTTLPTYSGRDAGRLIDPLDFLHGRGQATAESLPGALAADWTASGAGGAATCGIDSTNHFYVEVSGGGSIDFTIAASANNAVYGLDPAGHGLVGGVAPFRRTAPNPWRLGPILNTSFTIDPTGAPVAFTVGGSSYWQDLPTAIRALGSTDADDRNATNNLQALDVAINGASAKWFVDDTGHVVTAWRTGTMASVTWLDTDFRDRLGFSGLEAVATSGVVDYLRADYPLPGSVLLVDGLELHTIGSVTTRQVRDLSGGGVASIATDTHTFRSIAGYIDGPSMGATRDTHRHFIGSKLRPGFASYLDGQLRVSVYPRWGDPRRYLPPMAVTATRPAHSLLYTSGLDGYRGRVEACLARQAPGEVQIDWESEVRQHALLRWRLKELI